MTAKRRNMKKPLVFHLLVLFVFGFSFSTQADTEFIYAKVSTFLGDTYEGQIRWGNEEAMWTDRFNANKVYNENIDFLSDSFEKNIEKLDKTKPVVVYCRSGGRSAKCSKQMLEAGFVKIYDLEGGITKWIYEGFELKGDLN